MDRLVIASQVLAQLGIEASWGNLLRKAVIACAVEAVSAADTESQETKP